MNNENIEFGPTEYMLISLWAAFTLVVFIMLYKISKEADKE